MSIRGCCLRSDRLELLVEKGRTVLGAHENGDDTPAMRRRICQCSDVWINLEPPQIRQQHTRTERPSRQPRRALRLLRAVSRAFLALLRPLVHPSGARARFSDAVSEPRRPGHRRALHAAFRHRPRPMIWISMSPSGFSASRTVRPASKIMSTASSMILTGSPISRSSVSPLSDSAPAWTISSAASRRT